MMAASAVASTIMLGEKLDEGYPSAAVLSG